jgi:uncharacterized protein (TIGR02271 family)
MDRDTTGFVPRKGMRVIDVDGEHVGDIDLVEPATFIVRKGLFPQDHYIPLSAIASHDDDAVYLNVTRGEALERGLWNPTVASDDQRQELTEHEAAVTLDEEHDDATVFDEADAGEVTLATPMAEAPEAINTAEVTQEHVVLPEDDTDEVIIAADTAEHRDESHQTIELHAEEMTATTRPVERGVVRVGKRVVEEQQTFEVPVVEEEVIVTRRRVDKDVPDPDAVFTEEHIEIPLHGQEVEIETRAQVVEEIDVGKTAHEHIEQVTGTVRHEEARIEGDDTEPVDADRPDDGPV